MALTIATTTGAGKEASSLPRPVKAAAHWSTPANMVTYGRNMMPGSSPTVSVITRRYSSNATSPDGLVIMPGRPPTTAVTMLPTQQVCSAADGGRPAISATLMLSGISDAATTMELMN